MKVALVHEFLTQFGGAEQVLLALKELFPDAPIYTLVYNPQTMGKWFGNYDIKTSWIQGLPLAKTKYRWYLLLMPWAIQSFDFSDYDLVISDSSAFAKGIITHPPTKHISYIHTPTRYLWQDEAFYRETAAPKLLAPLLKLVTPWLRNWDYKAAQRPDYLLANSQTVAARVKKYYHRTATPLHSFVNAKRFTIASPSRRKPKPYYLLAGRIVPYKRYDIVIEAFAKLGLPLVVAGTGWGELALRREFKGAGLKSKNITFLGRVTDKKLAQLYRDCQAYLFPALEDFGITPLEAMASGRPVIAYGAGGATETIVDGKTGIFFDKQTPESVIQAIKRFEQIERTKPFNPRQIRKHALTFDKSVFKRKIKHYINTVIRDYSR
ncbi:glycosyltransferase [Candidatus Berkelbacteria bacterium]|nr:glycosyltransferase [Candidatus Berkelbacteria bacterium]